jgi:hypothetical protein
MRSVVVTGSWHRLAQADALVQAYFVQLRRKAASMSALSH